MAVELPSNDQTGFCVRKFVLTVLSRNFSLHFSDSRFLQSVYRESSKRALPTLTLFFSSTSSDFLFNTSQMKSTLFWQLYTAWYCHQSDSNIFFCEMKCEMECMTDNMCSHSHLLRDPCSVTVKKHRRPHVHKVNKKLPINFWFLPILSLIIIFSSVIASDLQDHKLVRRHVIGDEHYRSRRTNSSSSGEDTSFTHFRLKVFAIFVEDSLQGK